jgi:hypothetical protein
LLNIYDFQPTSTVTLVRGKVALPATIESEVERLWRVEQQRRRNPLFNGNIFSAVEISPQQIHGRIAEYRHLIAQNERPELFDVLQVRPVAVSGLLECAGGIVFGARAVTTTQDTGLWELVPSGGLETSKITLGDDVDFRAQILAELHEELGIDADLVSSVCPFCLVENLDTHVLDIGIAMKSPLSADGVLQMHRAAATNEYDELRVVPRNEVEGFIQGVSMQLVDVSAVLIQRLRKY